MFGDLSQERIRVSLWAKGVSGGSFTDGSLVLPEGQWRTSLVVGRDGRLEVIDGRISCQCRLGMASGLSEGLSCFPSDPTFIKEGKDH